MLAKTLFFALCATFFFASPSSTNAQTSLPENSSSFACEPIVKDNHLTDSNAKAQPSISELAEEKVVLAASLLKTAKKEMEATAIPTLAVTPAPAPVAPASEVTPTPAPVVSYSLAPVSPVFISPAPIVVDPLP